MADDPATIPTPPVEEVLTQLVEAVWMLDLWRTVESGCDGLGPVVMAYRALGRPVPPDVARWIASSPDSPPPFRDPVGYPWSTNPRVPEWQRPGRAN